MNEFGKRSLAKMCGVENDLIRVLNLALEIAFNEFGIDFGVIDGVRSRRKQQKMVDIGASKTMDSRHLTGHAVDLAVFIGKDIRWDFALYYKLAYSVKKAATQLGVDVVWGGSWVLLNTTDDLEKSVIDYVARKKRKKEKPLLDAGHFELSRKTYPATALQTELKKAA